MMIFLWPSGGYLTIYPYLYTMSRMEDMVTIWLRNFVLSRLFQDMN